jgi:hypothetical protein
MARTVLLAGCIVVACAKSSNPGEVVGDDSGAGAPNGNSSGASGGGAGDDGPWSLDAGGSSSGNDAPSRVNIADVNLPDVPMVYQAYDGDLVNAPGGCKAGHYTGSFNGVYSSFVTFIGLPLDVSGNVDLYVDESTNGEYYTISNGHVSGVASLFDGGGLFGGDGGGGGIPYSCDVVGTLNCKTKKIDNGMIQNCAYCVGIEDDAGNCFGIEGNFAGPVTADYDSSIHAFINGTWAANEVDESGVPLNAIVDASADSGALCSYGLFTYGGCGTWSAQLTTP